MGMKMNRLAQILLSVLFVMNPVYGAKLNMMETEAETEIPETVAFGVSLEGLYYTVIVQDSIVYKIELNGQETPEFIVETDWGTMLDFCTRYNEMGWLERLKFLIVDMKIPAHYINEFRGLVAQ